MKSVAYALQPERDALIMETFGIPKTYAAEVEVDNGVVPRFRLLPRVAASLWFIVLGVVFAGSILAAIRAVPPGGAGLVAWAGVASRCCTLVFFGTLGWLMLVRPAPVAKRDEPLPMVIAMAGTYAVWLLPLLPRAEASPILSILSAAIALTGSLLIVFTVIHLGRSFSIVPQARKLVVGGPYRFVRHPLYAAEELSILGVLLQYKWYGALLFLVVHLALQIRRMNYEESLLQAVFPDYHDYARRTARLIPGLW
jgi:protein-S-isoprenylcysteine O-methyltransferase Ste14